MKKEKDFVHLSLLMCLCITLLLDYAIIILLTYISLVNDRCLCLLAIFLDNNIFSERKSVTFIFTENILL